MIFRRTFFASVITVVAQHRASAVVSLDYIPLGARLANGLISYMTYVLKMLWPARLAVFYPWPPVLPAWQVATAGLALIGVSLLVLRLLCRSPYLAVGWFWYLGTLVPVIGWVQVGMQAHADRYTYLPSVGIFVMIAWGAADMFKDRQGARPALAGAFALVSTACVVLTWRQIETWRDSVTLFRHALAVTEGNHVAHNGLGIALQEQGRFEEAQLEYEEALRLSPHYWEARTSLGAVLLRTRQTDEAIRQLSEVVRSSPGDLEARIYLGIAYDADGKDDEAIAQLLEAVRIEPDSANARYNLGSIYAKVGRLAEAVTQFSLAVQLQPENAEIHYNLGVTLARQGDMNAAVAELTRAIQIRPDYGAAHNNLGSTLANLGHIDEAVRHFKEAVRLMPDSEQARFNLEYALSLRK